MCKEIGLIWGNETNKRQCDWHVVMRRLTCEDGTNMKQWDTCVRLAPFTKLYKGQTKNAPLLKLFLFIHDSFNDLPKKNLIWGLPETSSIVTFKLTREYSVRFKILLIPGKLKFRGYIQILKVKVFYTKYFFSLFFLWR